MNTLYILFHALILRFITGNISGKEFYKYIAKVFLKFPSIKTDFQFWVGEFRCPKVFYLLNYLFIY